MAPSSSLILQFLLQIHYGTRQYSHFRLFNFLLLDLDVALHFLNREVQFLKGTWFIALASVPVGQFNGWLHSEENEISEELHFGEAVLAFEVGNADEEEFLRDKHEVISLFRCALAEQLQLVTAHQLIEFREGNGSELSFLDLSEIGWEILFFLYDLKNDFFILLSKKFHCKNSEVLDLNYFFGGNLFLLRELLGFLQEMNVELLPFFDGIRVDVQGLLHVFIPGLRTGALMQSSLVVV